MTMITGIFIGGVICYVVMYCVLVKTISRKNTTINLLAVERDNLKKQLLHIAKNN